MWNILRKLLFALSIGLNLAFVTMFILHSMSASDRDAGHSCGPVKSSVSSSIHREVGVTDEQWEKIEPLVQEFREKSSIQRRKISILRSQLMELLARPDVDGSAITAKQEEILDGQRQMQRLVIDHWIKEKAILSSEQAKRLIRSLGESCRHDDGGGSGTESGCMMNKNTDSTVDKERKESQ